MRQGRANQRGEKNRHAAYFPYHGSSGILFIDERFIKKTGIYPDGSLYFMFPQPSLLVKKFPVPSFSFDMASGPPGERVVPERWQSQSPSPGSTWRRWEKGGDSPEPGYIGSLPRCRVARTVTPFWVDSKKTGPVRGFFRIGITGRTTGTWNDCGPCPGVSIKVDSS